MKTLIPEYWQNVLTLAAAGLFGAVVSIPSMATQGWGQKLFYILSGVISAYYLAPILTTYFNIGISPAGFLCGSFAGSIIAKGIELVRSIRLQDVIAGLLRK